MPKHDEHYIQNQILVALSANGCDIYRINVGKVPIRDNTGKLIRIFRAGPPNGHPDLYGFIQKTHEIFYIEVKDETGKPRPDQIRFHEHLQKYGIIHGIARSVDDARMIVEGALVGYGFDDYEGGTA